MPYASADGTRVYYEVHGHGPAIVLAHGSGGHHAVWWQQIPHLRDRFTVVALDFPGFGRSDSDLDEYDTGTTFRDAILAVMDDAGIRSAVVIGQSLGCMPALAVAVAHPERVKAVILGHSLRMLSDEEIQVLVRADRAEAEKLSVVDRLMSRRVQEEEPEKVFLFRQMGTFNQVGGAAITRSPTGSIAQVREIIAAGVHVCFLAGTADAVVRAASYARLRELLPEADIEVVEGAPHSVYWESPSLYNGALDRILARCGALA